MVHAKIIGNFAVVGHIEDGEVGEFANFERTDAVVTAEGVSGIDSGSGDSFAGRHAHLRAGKRQNHGHGESGAGAGVEVGGEGEYGPGVDELARRAKAGEAKVKAAAGEHGAGYFGTGESANVGGGKLFEMVGARGVHLDGEARRAGAGELFGMEAQAKAAGARGGEDLARLGDGERAAVAEHIAEFGEIPGGDLREPFAADEVDVSVGGFAGAVSKFSRNDVRAQKCPHDFERLPGFEFTERDEDLAFARPVEAVAGFGLERRSAVGGELREMRKSAGLQFGGGRRAEFADAVQNAAAGAGDFLVSGAGDTLFVFGGARGGVDEVSVGVDKAGEDDAATEIEFTGTGGFGEALNAAARANGGEASIADENRTIVDDAGGGEGGAAARRRATESENFGAIGNEPRIFCARIGHFGFVCSRY